MPYKILEESPDNWRIFFSKLYSDSVRQLIENYDTIKKIPQKLKTINDFIFFKLYADNPNFIMNYDDNASYITNHPGLNELLCFKTGNCNQISVVATYAMRSVGIASTVDFIPLWGSKNSGHATAVIADSTGKIRCAGYEDLNRAAKVFRISFRQQNIWKDSIMPLMNGSHFLLSYLQNNHWIDVTNEHTLTSDIYYKIPKQYNSKYAYICVYNYGQWKPLYYGKVKNSIAIFRNMGCSILYRVALPEKDDFKIVSNVFLLDSLGKVSYKIPSKTSFIKIQLSRINSGLLSTIKKNNYYNLYVLNNKSEWQQVASRICNMDSVMYFNKVPANAIYLLKDRVSSRNLECPFTYENGKQIWW